jgi:quercetin dioxygenase-like cupin family protein
VPFLDTDDLPEIERRPGWRGRTFHSPSMTFAHWTFTAGADVHEHRHPQEEVWQVIEGKLEITLDGEIAVALPGIVAIVPPDTLHSVRALTDGMAIVVDYPLRVGD